MEIYGVSLKENYELRYESLELSQEYFLKRESHKKDLVESTFVLVQP